MRTGCSKIEYRAAQGCMVRKYTAKDAKDQLKWHHLVAGGGSATCIGCKLGHLHWLSNLPFVGAMCLPFVGFATLLYCSMDWTPGSITNGHCNLFVLAPVMLSHTHRAHLCIYTFSADTFTPVHPPKVAWIAGY